MNKKQSYPALAYFISAYLHQDFDLEFGDFSGALQHYLEKENRPEQRQLQNDIAQLLKRTKTETKLQDTLFDKFDCAYNFLQEWPDAHHWLTYIGQMVKQENNTQ